MTFKFEARADVRALVGGVVLGAAVGSVLGGAYWAGGRAQAADAQVIAARHPGGAAQAVASPVVAPIAALAIAERPQPVLRALSVSITGPLHDGAPSVEPFRLADGSAAPARDVDCLTEAVYYEARGESLAGQAAIAQVVLNRVRYPAYPKSVCGVVYQGARQHACQFSFACNGALDGRREAAAWERARTVAERALAGFVMPVVGDATSFHIASVRPGWGNMLRVAQIGVHVFYRFGGHAGGASRFAGQAEPSAPGSDVSQRQILASTPSRMGSSSGDGRPAGQYLLASAVVTSASTSQAASQPAAPAPATVKPAVDTITSPSS